MKKLILLVLLIVGGFFAARDLANKSFILYYHNVGENKNGLKSLYVSPLMFKLQMKYLNWRGYKTIPLDELVDRIRNRKVIPKKTFAITFDDGYKNNLVDAKPVLDKYSYSATVFVIVNEIGKTLAHERASPETRMSVSELSEISKTWILGSHTMSHRNLSTLKYPEIKKELLESKLAIRKISGIKVNLFCYPMGRFNADIKALVKKTGYTGACSTGSGLINDKTDLYELPRIEWKEITASSLADFWDLKWFYIKVLLGV